MCVGAHAMLKLDNNGNYRNNHTLLEFCICSDVYDSYDSYDSEQKAHRGNGPIRSNYLDPQPHSKMALNAKRPPLPLEFSIRY